MTPKVLQQDAANEMELAAQILESEDRDHVVQTTLRTNEQVIARVTDGIYRQPASAFRELISNAYDADATRVVIKTDVPRFERIVVEDNGAGMSPQVLAHLLFNIGGSAKRNEEGEELGITSSDPFRSPKGRRLIGKIGIGLFSVSQLTHSFQIVTKQKGDDHRTVATIVLRQFSDAELPPSDVDRRYESGKVTIWREKATDRSTHGTTIALTSIRPQARDTLRSRDIWEAIEHNEQTTTEEEKQAIEPPRFHVGRVDRTGKSFKPIGDKYTALPWKSSDSPSTAFQKLVNCVWDQIEEANPNPKLDRIFDYYLRMVWQLALAVPLPYVDGHLFDMPASGWAKSYELSNKPKGSATPIEASSKTSIRSAVGLNDPEGQGNKFEVFIDNLKLARPIRYKNLPTTSHALKHPLVFLGKCDETFPKLEPELSGGRLKFEAYLFWSPKIAPTEHQGSLVRIHGASGTLFDPTFMRYQVSEQTRLRQITCEIFVGQGLDSALNIDRESFNNAHPHVVYLTRWLHGALRQLATIQKRAASEIRVLTREQIRGSRVGAIRQIASQVWADQSDDPASLPPAVEIIENEQSPSRKSDTYIYKRASVTTRQSRPKTLKEKTREMIIDEQLKAVAQVLASFNLIDQLTKKRQEALLKAIRAILEEREE